MRGDIWVESEYGSGSTFHFSCIMKKSAIPEFTNQGSGDISPEQKPILNERTACKYPINILVAEDNKVNQRVIMKVLSKLGYDAVCVDNGSQVVKEVESNPNRYDLIL
jgi:PleD family two-component response regulator